MGADQVAQWFLLIVLLAAAKVGYHEYMYRASTSEVIREALNRSTFFIPILTPNFIQSEFCLTEVEIFLEREKAPTHKPWGMYEFALSDPDETLVRIGWPSGLIG